MSETELLQAMMKAYWETSKSGTDAMRAVLGVLHANGYRRCAEGQKVTQYCSAWEQSDKACRDLTEKVIPNIRERAEKAEAERDALRAEVERLRADYGNACKAVVQAHAAATGRPGEGPFLGVIEDVAAVRAERDALRERNAEWERKASAWMASPQAVQRLDGYRELAQRLNAAETERDALRAERDAAIRMLAEWCIAVDENGAAWDNWDHHYKNAMYRPGQLRKLLDAAIDASRGES